MPVSLMEETQLDQIRGCGRNNHWEQVSLKHSVSHPVFPSHQHTVRSHDQSWPMSCDQHCRAGVWPSISLISHPSDQEASWRGNGTISKQPESLSYGLKAALTSAGPIPAVWSHWDLDSIRPQHSLSPIVGLSCGMWDLAPWPGIKPRAPALGAQSLSHWTIREVPPNPNWLAVVFWSKTSTARWVNVVNIRACAKGGSSKEVDTSPPRSTSGPCTEGPPLPTPETLPEICQVQIG